MADIIQLLPDSIANQIAAGEVIQRPASVVKELMENAVDAGSTEIKLLLKDAGKTLIQVIDNGVGMSETDARMAFERHATSKIRQANDLFHITTKGFRGEALASIAAISHVEMITKQADEELGRRLVLKASEVKKQEPCQALAGTSFAIKNLFFNIPARRKFLKSDTVELKHVLEEFKRVALAHPSISFSAYHNEQEVYILPAGNLRQRIIGVMNRSINDKLVPVEQNTDVAEVVGFVGKPEASKRSKGDQYLFVNNRYIKSNYFNHAIRSAYNEIIPKENYPLYFIYIDIDPEKIDINVHPTKTEIKFEDERIIYNYLKVATKHALGQYSIAPPIDFQDNVNMYQQGQSDRNFTPLNKEYHFQRPSASGQSWKDIYDVMNQDVQSDGPQQETILMRSNITDDKGRRRELYNDEKEPFQIHNTYLLSHIKSGYLLIDQQAAHERILYERYLLKLKKKGSLSQKELFPRSLELDNAKATILKEILPLINRMGFEVEKFGGNSFLIHGVPADLGEGKDSAVVLDELLAHYSKNLGMDLGLEENISKAMALSSAIKRGKKLSVEEMKLIIDELFGCAMPYNSPSGRKCFITVELNDLHNRFNK